MGLEASLDHTTSEVVLTRGPPLLPPPAAPSSAAKGAALTEDEWYDARCVAQNWLAGRMLGTMLDEESDDEAASSLSTSVGQRSLCSPVPPAW